MKGKPWSVEPINSDRKLKVFLLIEMAEQMKRNNWIHEGVKNLVEALHENAQAPYCLNIFAITFKQDEVKGLFQIFPFLDQENSDQMPSLKLFSFLKYVMDSKVNPRHMGGSRGDWYPIVIMLKVNEEIMNSSSDGDGQDQVYGSAHIKPSLFMKGIVTGHIRMKTDYVHKPFVIQIHKSEAGILEFFAYVTKGITRTIEAGSVRDYPQSHFKRLIEQFSLLKRG